MPRLKLLLGQVQACDAILRHDKQVIAKLFELALFGARHDLSR